RLEQRVRRDAGRGQHGLGLPAVGGQADQQVLGRDVLIVQLLGPPRRGGDRGQQRAGHFRGAERGAACPRQPVQALGGLLGDQRRVGADRPQQRSGGAVRLLNQGGQQVQRVDLRTPVRRGAPHRGGERVLALVGQFVVSHYLSPLGRPVRAGPPSYLSPRGCPVPLDGPVIGSQIATR